MTRNEIAKAAGTTPVPKAFSLPSMCFDGVPDDAHLVCLLGDPDCGSVEAVEEADILTARPWLFPMKFVVPWTLFIGIVITCMLLFMPWLQHEKPNYPLAFLVFMWVIVIPGTLWVLTALNRHFATKGDYFKVDMTRHTLELCPVGRTLKASEIITFVELTRFYRNTAGWNKTRQTGVLVRASSGRVELHPVVRELQENIPLLGRRAWADRLADMFQAPVRRVKLSKAESRALSDC
ncbi:MAG: hypothetical protein ACLQLG_09500 [Thermoguttaceae bacterium]